MARKTRIAHKTAGLARALKTNGQRKFFHFLAHDKLNGQRSGEKKKNNHQRCQSWNCVVACTCSYGVRFGHGSKRWPKCYQQQ